MLLFSNIAIMLEKYLSKMIEAKKIVKKKATLMTETPAFAFWFIHQKGGSSNCLKHFYGYKLFFHACLSLSSEKENENINILLEKNISINF